MRHVFVHGLAVTGLFLSLGGCGKTTTPKSDAEQNLRFELTEIGHAFALHQKEKGRPPARLHDLNFYESLYSGGFDALAKGRCLAIWGVDVNKADPNTLLAYVKEAPSQGGLVITADQKIKKVTADEFKSLKK